MKLNLAETLGLSHSPVGIWFTNEKPAHAFEFDPAKRPCVVSMLLAAAKGREVVVSDETCSCPGGAVGLGFGDAFARRNAPTMYLLSHGVDSPGFPAGAKLPPHMQHGECFFNTPETALAWKNSLKLQDADYRFVVFRPLDAWDGDVPDLVWLLANPDQLSALVVLCGYRTGRATNVIAPFCAGCQSIVLAQQQAREDQPLGIMGMFDIAQRHRIPKELLSLTVPYPLFAQMDADVVESCTTTPAWATIAGRFDA